jgi:hypothetical protein
MISLSLILHLKHSPDIFPTYHNLDVGCLSPPRFNWALEYVITSFHRNKQEGLEFNGTQRFLVCPDDVNLSNENVNIKLWRKTQKLW